MLLLYIKLSFLLGAILPALVGLLVLLNDSKKNINFYFFFLSLSGAIWSLGFLFMLNSTSYSNAYMWRFIMDSSAILTPVFFAHFVLSLLNYTSGIRRKLLLGFVHMSAIIIFSLNLLELVIPGIFTQTLEPKLIFNFYPTAGFGYYLFMIYYATSVPYSLFILFKGTYKTESFRTMGIKFVFLAAFLGLVGVSTAFLLTFNIPIVPFGIVFFSIYPVIIGYSILRHQLFDVKVIAAELITFLIWLALLVQIFTVDSTQEKLWGGLILFLTIFFGIFLIRSVIKEVEHREEIERLAKDLQKANVKLKELDKLKSEFVSIASHQLRSPLTAMKGYASLLLEGSYGKLPPAAKEAIENIFTSTDLMVNSVEDFLNVSRIEQGRMKYELSEFNIVELAKDVVTDQENLAEEKGLEIKFHSKDSLITIKADIGKIKQVFANLVDNAIKYTQKGTVIISVVLNIDTVRFSVKDTGIGMSKEDINKLFGRFSRAEGANRVNTTGTGLGLYVAKQMVEAHKGKIWAESDGAGLGSSFIVELPIHSDISNK